ncbi:MAG: hypothetical protein U1D26_00625 [Patescibacteria group bacterium]|nr:hypothetical protein [Patescibacteria group bacterium]
MHIIGTVLGVGAATFAEIHYTRFNADDIVTDDERKTLAITYTVMRAGLFLLVISGFGFLLYLRLTEYTDLLTSATFLAKMTVVGVLVGNALLLQARIMPLAVGAAVSLTSWYTALVLGVLRDTNASYVEILVYYVGTIMLVGGVLRLIRIRYHAPQQL